MQVDITDQTKTLTDSNIQLLTDILLFASQQEKIVNDIEVSVTIVTNEEIRKLNQQYRQIDAPTDVLSFEMDDPFMDFTNGEQQTPLMIGDIIISIDKVKEQSEEYDHSFERELAFLTVHGFLHLLGYTHDDEEEEKLMFKKQEQILEEFHLER